jgi:hypothetical protein
MKNDIEVLNEEDLKINHYEPLRKNRWVLRFFEEKNEEEKRILDTCRYIHLDYVQHKIKMSVAEMIENKNTALFLKDFKNVRFEICYLDPIGAIIKKEIFSKIKLKKHETNLDYADSEILSHELEFDYRKIQ